MLKCCAVLGDCALLCLPSLLVPHPPADLLCSHLLGVCLVAWPGELGSAGPLSLPLNERAAFTAAFHRQRGEMWQKAGSRTLAEAAGMLQT